MSIRSYLRYAWCVLTAALIFVSFMPGSVWLYRSVGNNDLNRWIHFMVYVAVVSGPFIVWRRASSLMLPLIIAMSAVSLETFQLLVPGATVQPQNIFADLFGAGAGLLLGFNLRMIQMSAVAKKELQVDRSRSV